MKFTSSALTIVTLSSSSLLFTQGTKVPIGQYELLAAGEPYGEVFTLEPFNAKVYYEAKTGASISTDVYSGVTGESPCDADSVEITIADVKTSGAYSTTGGNNGKVNMCKYNDDVDCRKLASCPRRKLLGFTRVTNEACCVDWQPTTNTPIDSALIERVFHYCVRSYLSADYDSSSAGDEIVSFVDTHIDLNVDFTAKFQNFTQEVNITATASKTVEQNMTKNVEIGQDFSVCVRPTEKYAKEGYAINGFKSVTCKNTGTSRALIKNSLADPLTTVSNATVASEHLSVDGEKAGASAGAFGSVVTAGYFANSENSFACEGEAKLNYTAPTPAPTPAPTFGSSVSFTYPKYNFQTEPRTDFVEYNGFIHGLCVMGASSATVSVSEPNTHNFDYHAFYDFKDNQVVRWKDEPWPYYDISGKGPNLCEGGIAFQPTLSDLYIPQGSEPTLTAIRNNNDALTFCAYVEDNPGAIWMHMDGGWPSILEGQGFMKTGSFSVKKTSFIFGSTITLSKHPDIMHMYCKEIAPSLRKLSTDFSLTFRDLQEATVAGDSPFATTIGLSSEGAEELMTASAATYNGLVGITTFGMARHRHVPKKTGVPRWLTLRHDHK
eukprot:jgi/Psemu1/54924/gm1.54924_g